MVVTLFGMVMLVKDLQSAKALLPIFVTFGGSVMLVKEVHL